MQATTNENSILSNCLDLDKPDPLLCDLRDELKDYRNEWKSNSNKHSHGSRKSTRKSKGTFTMFFLTIQWLINKLCDPLFEVHRIEYWCMLTKIINCIMQKK
jgi:hypothetical protein